MARKDILLEVKDDKGNKLNYWTSRYKLKRDKAYFKGRGLKVKIIHKKFKLSGKEIIV